MKLFDTAMDVVSQGACYQEGTKVLTQRGFIDFREVNPEIDLLAQVDEYNSISFTRIYELTKKEYKGQLVKIKGSKRSDLVDAGVTPNHRMVIEKLKKNKSGKYWTGATEIVLAKDLKLHRDNKMYLSGISEFKGRGLNDLERFMIAFQADGRKDDNSTARFRFKKQRKVDRLKSICDSLNWEYSENLESNGVTNIYIKNVSNFKKDHFEWVQLDQVSLQWCHEFIDENLS